MTDKNLFHTDMEEVPEQLNITDLPASKKVHKSQVNKFAAQCREQLSLIRSNTYLCRDEQVLQTIHSQLKETADYLLKSLKCESGLIEEDEGSTINKCKGEKIKSI